MKFVLYPSSKFKGFALSIIFTVALSGCAYLFGWDIHAPGILSENFVQSVRSVPQRIALYLPSALLRFESHERGGRSADPQTYHVGEAYGPMIVEAFQEAFSEFIFLEVEPTQQLLMQYAIPYLIVVRIKKFENQVSLKGQAISITTESVIFNQNLNAIERFESVGTSDATKVFAKKGGPQVNLNVAIENNIMSVVDHVQDFISQK